MIPKPLCSSQSQSKFRSLVTSSNTQSDLQWQDVYNEGVTENVVKDIYEHIRKTQERSFVLKISALEIYNETVVDLLNRDTGPLRLLDDPEKGTIVENLMEEVVESREHLQHLIGICEAQRQVGETALNDKSSRSHQIIRLTIQSSLREIAGCVQSFMATLVHTFIIFGLKLHLVFKTF